MNDTFSQLVYLPDVKGIHCSSCLLITYSWDTIYKDKRGKGRYWLA